MLCHEWVASSEAWANSEKEWRSRKVHGGRTGNLWLYCVLSASTWTSVLWQSLRIEDDFLVDFQEQVGGEVYWLQVFFSEKQRRDTITSSWRRTIV